MRTQCTLYPDDYDHVPDSKVPGANMGPTWVLSAPDGPHDGPWTLLSGMSYFNVFCHGLAVIDFDILQAYLTGTWAIPNCTSASKVTLKNMGNPSPTDNITRTKQSTTKPCTYLITHIHCMCYWQRSHTNFSGNEQRWLTSTIYAYGYEWKQRSCYRMCWFICLNGDSVPKVCWHNWHLV